MVVSAGRRRPPGQRAAMLRTLALVALTAGAWAASTNPAIAMAGGVCYRYDRDGRAVTQEGEFSWTEDYGTHFVLGASAPERAFVGYPWLDIDWSRSTGNGSRIDTVGILYIERIPFGETFYIGLGPGSFYNNARIEHETYTERAAKWRLGGRAVVGVNLPAGLYLESGYSLSGRVLGVKTDSVELSLGIRF